MIRRFYCLFFFFLIISRLALCESISPSQAGRILFLIQQGDHQQALKLYQEYYKANQTHDYEVIHRIGLGILDYGFRQSDPEIQLMTLLGANISAHEDAYYILEESLKSRYPQIQLIALSGLSQIHQDRADQAIIKAMGASHLLVRFEAINYLCKKKHPHAVDQAESLMYKSPKIILPLYPPLFARAGTPKAIKVLRKMINDPSEDVRKSVILCAAKYGRDDLLPQIRQQAMHFNYAQQEACAYALGALKDEQSIDKLKKLSTSQYPSVALAANVSLYQLGQDSAAQQIEAAALQEDVFAVSALGAINSSAPVLIKLAQNQNAQIRVNAIMALLEQRHPAALNHAEEILIHDRKDWAFVSLDSPGKAFTAWKVISGASLMLKEDIEAYKEHLEMKETVLHKVKEISNEAFLKLAGKITETNQNDLIPEVVTLLEEMGSPEALNCLKLHQQKLGAPFIRNYCNLALYRLGEPGPYSEQLRQWMKSQNQVELIPLKAFDPWEPSSNSYELKPEESSRLLIESFEAFAGHQDKLGIELLIDVIANGNQKNKYALAGVLVRAAQ